MHVPSLSTARFAVLVALFLVLFTSGIVVGAAGAPLILGQSNFSGGQQTRLTSSGSSATLKLNNSANGRALEVTDSAAAPLKITAPSGRPPMLVNSVKKVGNLNADRLDGRHANELSRADAAQSSGSTVIPVFTEVQHGTDLVVTAPTSGFVLVTASVMVTESNCTQWCYAFMRVAHVQTGATTVSLETGRFSGDWEFDTLTVSYAFPVSAGANAFRMLFDRSNDTDADGTVSAAAYTATALFTPFGSSGGSTLSD